MEKSQLDEREYISLVVAALKKLKGYSDELPPEMLHSTSPNPDYKCRTGFWGTLTLWLDDLRDEKKLPQELIKRCRETLYNRETHAASTGLTAPEDIVAANELLDSVLDYLETLKL